MMHIMNVGLRPRWESHADVVAYLCAVVSGGCFVAPVPIFYLMQHSEKFTTDVLFYAVIFFWLGAAVVGIAGLVAGAVALVKSGFQLWLGIEILTCSVPAVLAGIVAFLALAH